MARPKTTPLTADELKHPHELTAPLIGDRFTCPAGMSKAFLKDKEGNGLKVRVTANGAKAFVYEAKINGKVFSKTLGRFPLMPIPEAQAKARELATTVKTKKQDPRELERQQQEATAVANAAAAALVEADKIEAAAQAALTVVNSITVGEVWALYVEERRPHWGGLHYRDHIRKAAPGGEPFKRGTGTTVEGPLFALMAIPLRDLTAATVEAWAAKEAKIRQTSARLAWRMLKVFLGWCEEQINPVTGEHVYAALLPLKNPAKTKKSREHLGKAGTKSDALQREQLGVWFEAVQKIGNPVTAAYLQTLLLTGARPGEIIGVRWEDMNTQWKGLTIRDKVEGTRVIPLTQYVSSLLAALPRRNELVFSSPSSDTGHITEPNHAHTTACTVAGIDGMTLHGLRRSFKSLTEWLEIPAGVVAQLMGHKPSATAEKHYTVRPLDLLRVHHEKIEAWILEQAKITFDAKATPGALRVVS